MISYRAAEGFEEEVPYVIAVVELNEGPRMLSNIVGVEPDPEVLVLDMPLVVDFEDRRGFSVPVFRPEVRS